MCDAFQFANLEVSESEGNSPGTCLNTAGEDEDMFLFCGRIVFVWARVELKEMGSSSPSQTS